MEDALVLWCFTSDRVSNRYVLILVLMEDALVLGEDRLWMEDGPRVLILVLMEDALVLISDFEDDLNECLNPCFNGRCTRTAKLG